MNIELILLFGPIDWRIRSKIKGAYLSKELLRLVINELEVEQIMPKCQKFWAGCAYKLSHLIRWEYSKWPWNFWNSNEEMPCNWTKFLPIGSFQCNSNSTRLFGHTTRAHDSEPSRSCRVGRWRVKSIINFSLFSERCSVHEKWANRLEVSGIVRRKKNEEMTETFLWEFVSFSQK